MLDYHRVYMANLRYPAFFSQLVSLCVCLRSYPYFLMAHPVDSLSSGCRLHWENNLGFVASGASSRTKPWIAITTVIITIHPVITQDRRNYQNTYYSYHVLSLSLSSLMPFLLYVYIYVIIHQGPWVCPGMSAPASMAVSLGYHLSIRLSLRGPPSWKETWVDIHPGHSAISDHPRPEIFWPTGALASWIGQSEARIGTVETPENLIQLMSSCRFQID